MSTIVSNVQNRQLRFLDNIDGYKVHHDDVDPRGYTVKLSTGETIGEVEGLLADFTAKLVRYVEVEIDDDVIERHTLGLYDADDRHALVPVGVVDIDTDNNTVYLRGLEFNHLVDYPRYRRSNGYTTRYEIDTNDYLAGFHEYGSTYDRSRYSTDTYRNADRLDDDFYGTDFYVNRRS